MAERELKKKQQTTERADEAVEDVPAASATGEKLKAELEMMKKENAKLASAPSASAPSAPPLPSDPSAVAKAVAEAARKVSAARGL